MPRVSVIIPTYNRIDLLTETLDSVLHQTFADFEIVVVDDGSTDGTVDHLAGLDPRLRLVALPHIGHLDTVRNHGLAAARGDLIAFLDSDDLWRQDKLALQIAAFDHQPDLGLAFSDVVVLLPDGSVTPPVLTAEQKRSEGIFQRLLTGCFIHPSTAMAPRTLFDRLGTFETGLVSQGDYHFWMRAAKALPAACLPEPLVTVRRSAASMSQQHELTMMRGAIDALGLVARDERLTPVQHLLARRSLARWHMHLARLEPNATQARREVRQSLRLNPLQRQAWVEVARQAAGRLA
jgi:glycosyltransferase involved in cell wall biosynthesis